VQRETGTIFLPTRRRIDTRVCAPPWRRWGRGAVARAERTADGRVYLVVVRPRRDGLAVAVTGVRAREAEVLAPIAARVRRAAARGTLGATSAFEHAVAGLLDDRGRVALARLGGRCPAARAMRTMPEPRALLALPRAALGRCLGDPGLAARVHALARAFAAMTPAPPSRS
jgi:hypothetical protein